jgi:hypothetical protein
MAIVGWGRQDLKPYKFGAPCLRWLKKHMLDASNRGAVSCTILGGT